MAKFTPFQYVKTTVEEARKVVWPSRETVIRHTIMVIVSVAIGVVIFGGIDYGLQKLVVLAIQ